MHFRHFGKNRAGNANGCRFMADSIVGSSSMTVELCIQSHQSFLRDSAFTRISQFSLQHSVKQTSHFKNGQKRGTNLKQKQVLISGQCTKTMIAHRFSWTAKLSFFFEFSTVKTDDRDREFDIVTVTLTSH